jgi:ABC-type branched-subunit amino acid transport system ATPase component/branched-subunit amino acid ABC-type transport system permease component
VIALVTEHIVFLILGLGSGAVYAALSTALVVTYRSSGVINFSTGAIALYVAYTYAYLRQGRLLVPIPGLDPTIVLGSGAPLTKSSAIALSLLIAAVLGLILYGLVFRPLRNASPVAKAVASIGLMLLIQALLAARVGTNPVVVDPILPSDVWARGDLRIPMDRAWFALTVVAIGVVLGLLIRYTRFGLATRAVAETERGAVVAGLSPDRIAAMNWALSTMVAGISGILIAPIVAPVPISYTLFIVPALAAAMMGGFAKLGPAIAGGLAIGMVQSELTNLQTTVDWLPSSGWDKLVLLILILVLLVARGGRIPRRGAVAPRSLGRAPLPRNLPAGATLGIGVALILLFTTSGSLQSAVTVSLVLGILCLSQVVVTGYAGQISLAQLVLAGASAFLLARMSTDWGIPFPVAPLLSALAAAGIGVLLGLPALRLRGLPVAIVTLALAVTLESLWFQNPEGNGGSTGDGIEPPSLFGVDLDRADHPVAFGLMCLVVLAVVALGVALLRRSRLGASMLAVRANERSAAAAGIEVARVKIWSFAIGAFIAGIAGSLMGYQQNDIAQSATYTTIAGIGIFATVYLVGVTSVAGGVMAGVAAPGGVLFVALDRWLTLDQWFAVISGLLLVMSVIRYPQGAIGPAHEWIRRWRDRRSAALPDSLDADAPDMEDQPTREPGEVLLAVSGVGVRYGGVVALEDVSFEVRDGEILGLIGPNGAGKTTLLDAVSGFTKATGSVSLDGRSLEGVAPHVRTRLGLGRTFQGIELYEDLTVAENVAVGTTASQHRGDTDQDSLERMFTVLGLTEVAHRPVAELSQGRRQLVSVARTLAGRPRVVLLDEPAAGLDTSESAWLAQRLRAVRDAGTTVVLVDHDMGLVLDVCDRIIVLDLGGVIAVGTPREIQSNPDVIRAYLGGTAAVDDAVREEPALGHHPEVIA